MAIPVKEGFISFRNYRTWYRLVGDKEEAGKAPLLCLHGGPGMTHDYLETLEEIAGTGRRVIFYDQLGGGNSDHPHNPSLWNIELFVEEVREIRSSLGLDQMHLLGQSWGGFLALEYMLTNPSGVISLILANSAASTKRWIDEANQLRAKLPKKIQQVLKKHEDLGTTNDPAYISATELYYQHHVCRLNPWPISLNRTLEKLAQDSEVYNSMWGPSEFYCTGILRDWNIEHRLGEINLPTLILSGKHDESTPAINQVLHAGIQNSEWVIFEESAHLPHLEETGKYMQVLTGFLARVESAPAA